MLIFVADMHNKGLNLQLPVPVLVWFKISEKINENAAFVHVNFFHLDGPG